MVEEKTFYSVRFYEVVASRVRREIKRKNNNKWPVVLQDWFGVCGRCGYTLLLVPPSEGLTACVLLDRRVIVCSYSGDNVQMMSWIAHELCEALLHEGGCDGEELLDWPRSVDDCHHTSSLVQAAALGLALVGCV